MATRVRQVAPLPDQVRSVLTVLWAAVAAIALTAVTGALLLPSRSASLASAVPGADPAVPQPFTIHSAAATSIDYVEKKVTMTYGGVPRAFLEYLPAGAHAPGSVPVLVVLTGCCVPVDLEAGWINVDQAPAPVIQVFPLMVDRHWNAGACCFSSASDHADDAGFVSAVVDAVDLLNSDARPGQAYLAGYSNGGKLAMRIACTPPKWLQAVAVYGATRTTACPTTRPLSLLEMVGSVDTATPIIGQEAVQNGFHEPTVTELMDDYLHADGCRPPEQQAVAGIVTEVAWTHCQGGRMVVEAIFAGLDHTYPEAKFVNGPSANQLMWNFFAALGATAGVSGR